MVYYARSSAATHSFILCPFDMFEANNQNIAVEVAFQMFAMKATRPLFEISVSSIK